MPPTGRRRRNKEPEQRADAEVAEAATPSRKRRRVNGPNNTTTGGAAAAAAAARTARRVSAESDATIENGEGDENGADEEINEVDAIIQKLRCAPYQVGVSIDYSNIIVPPNEEAFAKIAGRSWTYYVKTTNVIIGRPNAKTKRESMAPSDTVGTPVGADTGMMVNIDLGPDQQISRVHAEIAYDSEKEVWVIICNGRNGFHLDETRVERGQQYILRSGSVISILGTQMIFILPNQLPTINEGIRRSLLEEGDADDEQYQPGDGVPRGTNVRHGGGFLQHDQQPDSSSRPAGGSGTQAAQTLAALSTSQHTPGTPRIQPPALKSKNSPAYVKGVMLESTDDVDYSVDSARDMKPPHSYAQMIGQAILSREEENATLAQIYEFIKQHYAFFRFGGGGWQNSIRHNLSLSKAFEKIPRRTDEPGKGMKWQIVEEAREEFMKKNFHDNRKLTQRRLGSSGPNSPVPATAGPGAQTERLMGALHDATYIKRSGSPTPPRHAYPAPNESFTPDRGPRGMLLQTLQMPSTNGAASMSATSEFVTPTFERTNPLASQQTFSAGSRQSDTLQDLAVDSPPHLTSNPDAVGHGIIHTPLPARSARKPILSTVKPPSFYAKELFSSPAPFWKFADVGSTPLRPMPDLSPEKFRKPTIVNGEIKTDYDHIYAKMEKVEKKEEDDEKPAMMKDEDAKAEAEEGLDDEPSAEPEAEPSAPNEPEIIPPSSPLGNKAATAAADDETEGPDESPTRTISRPVSRREPATAGPSLTNGVHSIAKLAPPPAQPRFSLGVPGIGAPGFRLFTGRGAEPEDDDEDDGIDLSKTSFQKIGQYHRVMNAARPAAPR